MTDDARLLSRTATHRDGLPRRRSRPARSAVRSTSRRCGRRWAVRSPTVRRTRSRSSRSSLPRPTRDSSRAPGRATSGSSSVAACRRRSRADWLTSAWDQNAGLYVISPAAAVAEEVAGDWLVELLGLPAGTSVGFVTGATMANFTALAAARHAVLARSGWDVERQGLQGAPPVTVVTHGGTHVTVYASLQMLGLGREGEGVRKVAADDQGRMRPDALREVLAGVDGPVIVCAAGRQREHRRVRSVRRADPDRARARRLGPHRRGVRDLGGRRCRRCAT